MKRMNKKLMNFIILQIVFVFDLIFMGITLAGFTSVLSFHNTLTAFYLGFILAIADISFIIVTYLVVKEGEKEKWPWQES